MDENISEKKVPNENLWRVAPEDDSFKIYNFQLPLLALHGFFFTTKFINNFNFFLLTIPQM